MAVKLVVSDDIEFDVKFTLNDNGKSSEFGFRAHGKRLPQDRLTAEVKESGLTLSEFLQQRGNVRMVSWIGDSPLVDDDTNAAIEAGSGALQALLDIVSNMAMVLFNAYLDANGAKAKQGN